MQNRGAIEPRPPTILLCQPPRIKTNSVMECIVYSKGVFNVLHTNYFTKSHNLLSVRSSEYFHFLKSFQLHPLLNPSWTPICHHLSLEALDDKNGSLSSVNLNISCWSPDYQVICTGKIYIAPSLHVLSICILCIYKYIQINEGTTCIP